MTAPDPSTEVARLRLSLFHMAEALHRRVLAGPVIWPSSTEQGVLAVACRWGWRPETMPSEDASPNWWQMSAEYRTWLANAVADAGEREGAGS